MEKFTFITPVYISEGDELGLKHFKKTLYSVSEQTSPEWSMVIIDDNSNNKKLVEIVNDFRNYSSQDIILIIASSLFKPFKNSELICNPSPTKASLDMSPPSKTGIIFIPNLVANS